MARLGGLVYAGCDVDSIALQMSVFRNDIVDIDADTQMHCESILVIRLPTLSALDVGCPSHRVNGARELHQHAIAGKIDEASTVSKHVRFHDLRPQDLPAAHGLDIIKCHQTGKARDVSKGDGGKPSVDG
ncbi:MAG: hypothetical protein WAV38_36250 [Xanthobacteraceae bacterium]